jgi:hypothetical protein
MIARSLISSLFPVLLNSETVAEALEKFNVIQTDFLPVLSNGEFLGYVNRNTIENQPSNQAVDSIDLYHPESTLQETDDYLKVLSTFSVTHEKFMPVLNGRLYHGTVSIEECSMALADTYTAEQPGGVLFISVSPRDYSLSHLSRIVEMEGAKIIGLWIERVQENGRLLLLLKIDTNFLSGISSTLDASGFSVIFRSGQGDDEIFKDRYDSLMKYLDFEG